MPQNDDGCLQSPVPAAVRDGRCQGLTVGDGLCFVLEKSFKIGRFWIRTLLLSPQSSAMPSFSSSPCSTAISQQPESASTTLAPTVSSKISVSNQSFPKALANPPIKKTSQVIRKRRMHKQRVTSDGTQALNAKQLGISA